MSDSCACATAKLSAVVFGLAAAVIEALALGTLGLGTEPNVLTVAAGATLLTAAASVPAALTPVFEAPNIRAYGALRR